MNASEMAARLRQLEGAVSDLRQGRVVNFGAVTLTASATSTVVSRFGVSQGDAILLVPQTASAGAAIAAGVHAVATAKGEFTITHPSNAATDQNFVYYFFRAS